MKPLRALLLSACAVAIALTPVSAQAQNLEHIFQSPPKDARPLLRWWWPGNAVTAEKLREQIAQMDKAGFGGAEIQSFNPGVPNLSTWEKDNINTYALPAFFANVRAAAEAAQARGMVLDYTLGSAWPSGGGFAIPPEKAYLELAMARTEVTGGGKDKITPTIPTRTKRLGALSSFDPRSKDPRAADWPARMDARARIVAVLAVKGTAPELDKPAATAGLVLTPWGDVKQPGTLDPASILVLTDKLRDDGTLDWKPPPGTWQVFVFKQFAANVGVLAGSGEGPQLILDHMDKTAFAAHAARVGDPLRPSLGNAMGAMRAGFVDSLELMQDLPWTGDFLAQFQKRRGYDLTPYLPLVIQPGWMQAWGEHWSPPYFNDAKGDIADRVRADYRRTISDLMFEGFIEPFVAWNHANGLKAKFQAHGGALDIVRGYGIVDIPETEDLVHDGDPIFMRFARSGAHLYGRTIISAESVVWKDRPYDVTPDEMRRRVDLILAGGVNSLVLHGYNYERADAAWPGWHAFQPSAFATGFSTMLNEGNPIWAGVPTLATYITRLQAVLRQGTAIVPVAYFYGQTGYYVGIEDAGAGAQAAEKAFLAAGYDFDRINPDAIADAKVEGRVLLSKGGARYPALVLPPLDGIRAETAESIAAFAKDGLPVIFTDKAPDRDEGLADADQRDIRVRTAIAATIAAGARVVPAAEVSTALASMSIPANLRFTGPDASGLVYVQRRVGDRLVTFIHNRAGTARDASLILPAMGGVSRWNALDGSTAPVNAQAVADGTAVTLALADGESALLVLDPTQQPQTVPVPQKVAATTLSPDGWRLTVDGHGPKGAVLQASFKAITLSDWSQVETLKQFAGTGTYDRKFKVERDWLRKGNRVWLDLGVVHDMAVVTVNGRAFQPLITAPFRLDVTKALRAGNNDVSIAIMNTPQNAMIDPQAPGFRKLKPVPAGLIGPVALEIVQ